jgi:hypothetical protein
MGQDLRKWFLSINCCGGIEEVILVSKLLGKQLNVKQLKFRLITVVFTAFLIGGFLYVGATWSPSSYAIALKRFGVDNVGVVQGTPRPIRSDEWAVATPLMQITVNNGFDRYNKNSPYNEDLRLYISLPIMDWGFIFKPDLWLYKVAHPAYAFSFHHYTIFGLFIIGYTLFFQIIGIYQIHALLLSPLLFFTGYVQYWWTILGPGFAIFPWLFVALEWEAPPYLKFLRFPLFYWIATSWLISIFYPPLLISLAFVGLVTILAFRPTYLRGKFCICMIISSIAAICTVLFYLQDYLLATITTSYPGQRMNGGGGIPFGIEQWLSQFFPLSQVDNHQSLIGRNICEVSTVGAFYTIAALFFLDYSKWNQVNSRYFKRVLLILTIALIMTWVWILLPLPAWVGAALLWNRVPSTRMFFASGLLLIILIAFLVQQLGIRFSWMRMALFSMLLIGVWIHYKFGRSHPDELDLIILAPIYLLVLFKRQISEKYRNTALLSSALIVGYLAFGSFNPIQSSWTIFTRPTTPVTQQLDAEVAQQSNGLLAIADNRFPGATLNGWGYRSIAHLLAIPQLDFFRKFFPSLPEEEFQQLFNRYAHIILTNNPKPKLIAADAVALPVDAFHHNRVHLKAMVFR